MASEEDIEFMKFFYASKKGGIIHKLRGAVSHFANDYIGVNAATIVAGEKVRSGVYAEDSYLPPRAHPNPPVRRNQRNTLDGKTIQYRVKPFPDPSRPVEETKWLTKNDIEREALDPSTHWVEAGSGSVGKFYVEVIGCDNLPNLDISITGRDKSDPFVCLVYEDCIVNTDVINDCLSPRWMPWSQRAFVFNVMHPSSQIFIGIFDFDEMIPGSTTPARFHSKIGRVVMNPTNFRPNTVYTLRYHIFDSDEPDRKIVGTILLRCRYESKNEREILLSQFQLKSHYNVSTMRQSDFRSVFYTVTNDVSETRTLRILVGCEGCSESKLNTFLIL
jgi:hypothetical protein